MIVDPFKLRISADVAESIRAHGAETYPEECCGALLGRDGDGAKPREIFGLYALVNRRKDSPQNRFAVSSRDVLDAERVAAERGLDVVGWYHSHPDHPARPSDYDREHAWPWYSYIIVKVQSGAPKEMTSWRLQEDRERYSEETIEIRGEADARD
jgi:proteasome lid subunit RPN8/RPN11